MKRAQAISGCHGVSEWRTAWSGPGSASVDINVETHASNVETKAATAIFIK